MSDAEEELTRPVAQTSTSLSAATAPTSPPKSKKAREEARKKAELRARAEAKAHAQAQKKKAEEEKAHGHGHGAGGHGHAHGGGGDGGHRCASFASYMEMMKEKDKPKEEKPERKTITFKEQMEKCQALKEEGNRLYRDDLFYEAGCKYSEVIQNIEPFMVEFEVVLEPKDKEWVDSIMLPTRLNLVACMLRCDFLNEAIDNCRQVLDAHPTNVKAFFRRAQAYIARGDLDLAKQDLNRALEIDSDNVEIKRELALLKIKENENLRKEKDLFRSMFQAKQDPKSSQAQNGTSASGTLQQQPVCDSQGDRPSVEGDRPSSDRDRSRVLAALELARAAAAANSSDDTCHTATPTASSDGTRRSDSNGGDSGGGGDSGRGRSGGGGGDRTCSSSSSWWKWVASLALSFLHFFGRVFSTPQPPPRVTRPPTRDASTMTVVAVRHACVGTD